MIQMRPKPIRTRGLGVKAGSRFLPLGLIAGPAGGIVTALLKNWKLAIFGLLLAFIFYQNYVSFELLKPFGFRTIPGMQQDLEEAERIVLVRDQQLEACEEGRTVLKAEIETTNAQIDKWAALTAKLQGEQSQLTTTLANLQEKSKAELEIILSGPIPQTCEGAVKLLREAVTSGELKWQGG